MKSLSSISRHPKPKSPLSLLQSISNQQHFQSSILNGCINPNHCQTCNVNLNHRASLTFACKSYSTHPTFSNHNPNINSKPLFNELSSQLHHLKSTLNTVPLLRNASRNFSPRAFGILNSRNGTVHTRNLHSIFISSACYNTMTQNTSSKSYSTQKHAIVATTKGDKKSCDLKQSDTFSNQSTIFKYLPLHQQKSGQITTQHRICRDDPYEQIHYVCIDEPTSKDVHFYEQFSDVQGNELHLSYRSLGEKLMKSIIASAKKEDKDEGSEEEVDRKESDDTEDLSIEVHVDNTLAGNQAFIEGLVIGNYDFKKFNKVHKNNKPFNYVQIVPLSEGSETSHLKETERVIETATILARSQLLARYWMDLPSNLKTPTKISEFVKEQFSNEENVTVQIRDRAWIEEQKMGSFLSVTQGSAEEPRVVEIFYNGDKSTEETTLQYIGKGITFDSGGISLKPSRGMKDMRGDMGGAATALATMKAIAQLKPKINVRATAFFCENMPSGTATKPGDVFVAMNGKTIEVDNTDAEGRLILADAIYYSTKTYNPKYVINLATLTGAIVVALGSSASGTYVTHNAFWKKLERAGYQCDDYLWRMPLFSKFFTGRMSSTTADICNVSSVPEAGSCAAAAFLTEFIHFNEDKSRPQFAHIDIAGTAMESSKMTGRPTRTLVQFAKNLSEEV